MLCSKVKKLTQEVGHFKFFEELNVTSTTISYLPILSISLLKGLRLVGSSTWMAFGGNTRDLAQLEKKRTRLRLYTNNLEEIHSEPRDDIANYTRRRQIAQETASWISKTVSERNRLKETLEDSTGRR
ncbi:hypothetical protein Tco_0284338, partial [Tanacetum coccineum]